ncbi:helix-turn-helix domain-containing protein [Marinobacterium stanieri]|uniref:Transcriptional regulator, MerR family n=1 Tax=Marinobacterium stanieri TaxID=49186 RepID=A0A1N6UPV8_9GAMM|nr:transcriptional regulator, MerR family [Marinobacterium stanieri]
MNLIDIGVLSKASGVATSTLRYYEEIGLIKSIARNGLRRQYHRDTLVQLALISLGKSAGFSLEEIGSMFDKDRKPNLPRPTLSERADELDRQARRLKTLSNMLRHVAECPAPSHLECFKFQKLLRAACPTEAARDVLRHAVKGSDA